jgi:hypothetical protein
MRIAQSLTGCFPVAHCIGRDPGSYDYGNDERGVCDWRHVMDAFPDWVVL